MGAADKARVPLRTEAPDFALKDVRTGEVVRREDFAGKPLLVIFMCNHCPYVRHVEEKLTEVANDLYRRGLGVVAISANDPEAYPDDAPERLAEQAERLGMEFPYLFDESQEVAKAYRAVTTPDLFLYDPEHRLFYRGRFDAARPKQQVPVTGEDLLEAVRRLEEGEPPPEEQYPSVGCSIKWRPGNEPEYYR